MSLEAVAASVRACGMVSHSASLIAAAETALATMHLVRPTGDPAGRELEARMQAVEPVLAEHIDVAMEGSCVQLSSDMRARRNLSEHADFGVGPAAVPADGATARRRQRAGRKQRQRVCSWCDSPANTSEERTDEDRGQHEVTWSDSLRIASEDRVVLGCGAEASLARQVPGIAESKGEVKRRGLSRHESDESKAPSDCKGDEVIFEDTDKQPLDTREQDEAVIAGGPVCQPKAKSTSSPWAGLTAEHVDSGPCSVPAFDAGRSPFGVEWVPT